MISRNRPPVQGAALLSPEGRWALIGDRLWDTEAAEPVRQMALQSSDLRAVAVRSDLQVLGARSIRRSSYLVDVLTGGTLRGLAEDTRINVAAAFNPGGTRLIGTAMGYGDAPLVVWDVDTGKEIVSASDSPSVVGVSSCGAFAAASGAGSSIRVWDLAARKELAPLPGEASRVTAVAISHHAMWIAAGYADGSVRLFYNRNPQEPFAGHDGPVTAIAMTPGGRLILSGSRDGSLRVWLRGQAEPLDTFQAEAAITDCRIATEGHSLVVTSADGQVYFLNR